MRKAQSERMTGAPTYSDVQPPGAGNVNSFPWMTWSGAFWSETVKWMEFWQRETQRMWGIGPTMFALRGSRPNGDMRRASDMPWMPRMEAQIIPLRRNTDPPGAEATRFSMRLPMPWPTPATNVVAIETILGMAGDGAQPRQPGEQGGEGPVGGTTSRQRT